MARPWFLIALLVALSGTPLRLAEAASDLARSLVEADEAGAIGEVDGGVGDEPDETIRQVGDLDFDPAGDLDLGTPADWAIVALPALLHPPLRPGGHPALPPSTPPRRHVLLRRFLC